MPNDTQMYNFAYECCKNRVTIILGSQILILFPCHKKQTHPLFSFSHIDIYSPSPNFTFGKINIVSLSIDTFHQDKNKTV